MGKHFHMMGHYMLLYNRRGQMMAVPIPHVNRNGKHVEDTLNADPSNINVSMTLAAPAHLQAQEPTQKKGCAFTTGMIVAVTVTLWMMLNIITLYTILRDSYRTYMGQYDPQFCIRSSNVSYH